MKKLCTTKKVLFGTLIVCGILLVTIVVTWILLDRSDAAGLAGVVTGLAGIVVGFYEWKARAENLAKYGMKEKISMCSTEQEGDAE